MRKLVSAALLALTASAAFAQDPPPAGSAERGQQAYMKYMCYTCHGTLGQGADRGTGPKLAPGDASLCSLCAPDAYAASRHAALPAKIFERPGARRYLRLPLVNQTVARGEGDSTAGLLNGQSADYSPTRRERSRTNVALPPGSLLVICHSIFFRENHASCSQLCPSAPGYDRWTWETCRAIHRVAWRR